MKKILTFAVMAIFLGGFVFNASAQEALKGKSGNKSNTVTITNVKQTGENMDKVLDNYDKAVDHCLRMYNALESKDATVKASTKEFNKALTKAENLRDKLEKAKGNLTRSQVKRFNDANQKLSRVYQK